MGDDQLALLQLESGLVKTSCLSKMKLLWKVLTVFLDALGRSQHRICLLELFAFIVLHFYCHSWLSITLGIKAQFCRELCMLNSHWTHWALTGTQEHNRRHAAPDRNQLTGESRYWNNLGKRPEAFRTATVQEYAQSVTLIIWNHTFN